MRADRRLVDVDDLVDVLQPLDAVVRGRGLGGAVELARHRLVERVDQQGGLAAAGHAGDAGEQAERDLGGDILQVMATRANHLDGAARVHRPPLRDRHHQLAGQVLAGDRLRFGDQVFDRAGDDDLAAVDRGAGADVDEMVGSADRVLVVLHHDDGVADVAQAVQRLPEPRIVALVQADRGSSRT